jgi:hypothetical protein
VVEELVIDVPLESFNTNSINISKVLDLLLQDEKEKNIFNMNKLRLDLKKIEDKLFKLHLWNN